MHDLFMNMMTGSAASPFYYILLLLQMELLLPLILKMRQNKIATTVLWFVTPAYLVYIYAFYFKTGVHPPLYGTLFPAYIVFYLLGLEIRERHVDGKSIWIILTLVSLLLSIVEGIILSSKQMPVFGVSQLKISSFLYSTSLIIMLVARERFVNKPTGIWKIISRIGDDSYAIFFLHCFWIKLIGSAIKKMSVELPWIVSSLIYLLLTVVMCEITICVVRTISDRLGCKKYLKYIGL